MSLIKVNGKVNIDGMVFHDIEGGFGERKKAMLVKEIANIHTRQESHINELINNNIKRFKYGTDLINILRSEDFKIVVDDLGLRTSNRQKYSYLLSERGYAKLLKILEDDVAWEQYEKIVDGYFNMRQAINEYSSLSKEVQAIFQLDKKQQAIERKTNEALEGIRELKEETPLFGVEMDELQKVVKKVGTSILGGYKSLAYCCKPIRTKVYADIQSQIKRNFGVSSYKAIKRKDLSRAIAIVNDYRAPLVLVDEITTLNNQEQFNEVS